MTPVINPWMIYLIDICSTVKFGFLVATLICGYIFFACLDYGEKFSKKCCIAFIICALFTICIPFSKTVTKMVIAKNVTYERVDKAQDVVEKVYNDILSAVSDKKGE